MALHHSPPEGRGGADPSSPEVDAALPAASRICFVADGRSPIARNWIGHFVERGYEVHLLSTFPCGGQGLGVAGLHVVPAALAGLAGGGAAAANGGGRPPGMLRRLRARAVPALFPTVFGWVAPLEVRRWVGRVRALVERIDPVLVHAMRIPYEGVLAALALEGTPRPLLVSVWGNDLELWAARYPLVARLTRRVLARADALHPDCLRDLHLAAERWGWDASRPAAVLPGNGGVRAGLFHPAPADPETAARHGLPLDRPVVLNPRGFRNYVRNDAFFRAIPLVLERRPDAVFAGVGMAGDARAERWVKELGIGDAVRLLPVVPPAEMAALFRIAAVAVSPSEFDGTPNTLLEAMACGAFPVAGDIASVREWIDDGANGLLVDPGDPRALADAILRAIGAGGLRERAAARNRALVAERA
ncbi:MAG TPA: glycosyltransferase family 4 protein, partial [Longimicrobium sp.]